jgi:hypothetical protein
MSQDNIKELSIDELRVLQAKSSHCLISLCTLDVISIRHHCIFVSLLDSLNELMSVTVDELCEVIVKSLWGAIHEVNDDRLQEIRPLLCTATEHNTTSFQVGSLQ